MNEKSMSEALDAIHDTALKLLEHNPSNEIEKGLELIISLARYKYDVRSIQEKKQKESE